MTVEVCSADAMPTGHSYKLFPYARPRGSKCRGLVASASYGLSLRAYFHVKGRCGQLARLQLTPSCKAICDDSVSGRIQLQVLPVCKAQGQQMQGSWAITLPTLRLTSDVKDLVTKQRTSKRNKKY